ncbi:hypothetical protein KI387_032044, partial [Taxus chinensis]
TEWVTTPPHIQEEGDEHLDEVQGECHFKRVFRRTKTQGATPPTIQISPRISPKKETIGRKKRNPKLNEEVEEFLERTSESLTQQEDVEDPTDEEMK